MIVRMWHGRVPAARAEEYRRFLNERAVPDYRAVPGNLSVHILERADGAVTHFVTMTLWDSLETIRGFAGADIEAAKYYPEDRAFLLEFEPRVAHYEVVGHSVAPDEVSRRGAMAIDLLTVCEWLSGGRTDHEVRHPSWADVEQAIRALDGESRNDVYLTPDDSDPGTYLCVGGGCGRYIVTGAVETDKEFPTLVASGRPATPEESLVVGGQSGLFPANWVVGLEEALDAARAFYDAKGFAQNFSWTRV